MASFPGFGGGGGGGGSSRVSNFDPRGMSRGELESWKNSGKLGSTALASVNAKLAGMPKQGGDISTGGGFDMADIRAKLQGTQKGFLDAQNMMIDRNADRAGEQGLSDMISSGLAGTTAVGGMRAAVAESAGMQKADIASRAQMQTDQLALQYASLASQNMNQAANREFAGGGGTGATGARGAAGAGGSSTDQAANTMMPRREINVPNIGVNNAGGQIDNTSQLVGLQSVREGGSQVEVLDYATRRNNPFYYVDTQGRIKTRPRRSNEPLSKGTKAQAQANAG